MNKSCGVWFCHAQYGSANTYRSLRLFLYLSGRKTHSLCHMWSSLPFLSGILEVQKWSLSPSFLPSCPVSSQLFNILSFFPQASQNMSCFSLVRIPQYPLPNVRIPCGRTRSYLVSLYFFPSWTFLRCLNAYSFFLSCAVFRSRTQIFFVYPTINCFERRHFHAARCVGYLFGRPCLGQLFVYVIQYFLFPKHPAATVTVAQTDLLCVNFVSQLYFTTDLYELLFSSQLLT